MKKCVYCREDVQDDAIKCRHCQYTGGQKLGGSGQLSASDKALAARLYPRSP